MNAEKSFNQIILENYQKAYPNLSGFIYDDATDSLIFNGESAKLNGYGLSRIDPIFFSLAPEDILAFFKNGFYQKNSENEHVEYLLNKFVITEEEVDYLQTYAKKYIARFKIYSKNKAFFDQFMETNESVKSFASDLLQSNRIIDQVKNGIGLENDGVANAIESALQEENSMSNSNNLEQGMSLARTKPGYGGQSEDPHFIDQNQGLGIYGYTSLALIIISVVTMGIYLAIKILP